MEMDPRKKYGWHSPSGGWVVTGLSPLGEREREVDRAVRAAHSKYGWGKHSFKQQMKPCVDNGQINDTWIGFVCEAWREQHAR